MSYVVDAEAGIVYGRRGKPVGSKDTSGYLQIDMRPQGMGVRQAHRVIWEAVHGPIPSGMEINHINGVKDDNRLGNLELVTHQANVQHAYRIGLKSNAGDRSPRRKLWSEQVVEIRRLAAAGMSATKIALIYGVSRRTISDIVVGRTWREAA